MATYQFKTSINCGSCVATVRPYLDALEGLTTWEVATQQPTKILTVETSLSPEIIKETVQKAGFKIEELIS